MTNAVIADGKDYILLGASHLDPDVPGCLVVGKRIFKALSPVR